MTTIVLTPPEHMDLARQVAGLLDQHYPGHPWYVEANAGMVTVKLPAVALGMGFRLAMPELKSAQELKAGVIWAGGEFLERHGIPRRKFIRDLYPERLAVRR